MGTAQTMQKLELNKDSSIKYVIAVMSGKGGVGKSSVSGLLAASLQKKGFKVGVLDADITGPSIPKIFGVTENLLSVGGKVYPAETDLGVKVVSVNLILESEDDPVIWRAPLLNSTISQFWTDITWGELDYLIVDLPPGTADVSLTVLGMLPVTGVVMVSSPQELAQMVVRKALKMAAKMSVPLLGLVENMSYAICPHCGEKHEIFGPSKGRQLAEMFDIRFLGSLPLDPKLTELADQGRIESYTLPNDLDLATLVDRAVRTLA